MNRGYVVTTEIVGAHHRYPDYPLLPGDLIVRDEDGRFTKECPGLAIVGFTLTDEQVAAMTEVEYQVRGLTYTYEVAS